MLSGPGRGESTGLVVTIGLQVLAGSCGTPFPGLDSGPRLPVRRPIVTPGPLAHLWTRVYSDPVAAGSRPVGCGCLWEVHQARLDLAF